MLSICVCLKFCCKSASGYGHLGKTTQRVIYYGTPFKPSQHQCHDNWQQLILTVLKIYGELFIFQQGDGQLHKAHETIHLFACSLAICSPILKFLLPADLAVMCHKVLIENLTIQLYYYYRFMALWILSRTARVSRYQKGKTMKVKSIWIYWSKRLWVAVASAGTYANLHFSPDR